MARQNPAAAARRVVVEAPHNFRTALHLPTYLVSTYGNAGKRCLCGLHHEILIVGMAKKDHDELMK